MAVGDDRNRAINMAVSAQCRTDYAACAKKAIMKRTQAIQTTKHGASVVAARNLDISPPPSGYH